MNDIEVLELVQISPDCVPSLKIKFNGDCYSIINFQNRYFTLEDNPTCYLEGQIKVSVDSYLHWDATIIECVRGYTNRCVSDVDDVKCLVPLFMLRTFEFYNKGELDYDNRLIRDGLRNDKEVNEVWKLHGFI